MTEVYNQVYKYNKAFFKYENDIKKVYKGNTKIQRIFKGYLIYKEQIDYFKKIILYDKIEFYLKEKSDDKKILSIIKNYFNLSDKNNLQNFLKPKKFDSLNELVDCLEKDEKYILIDSKLWKDINSLDKKEEFGIDYIINSSILTIYLNDKESASFEQNNNIIELSVYVVPESQNNKIIIDKIYKSIIEYYTFENQIFNQINKNNDEILKNSTGYLAERKWIEQWKKYSDYNFIKYNFLNIPSNNNNEKTIKEHIKKNLENNQSNKKLDKISIKSFKYICDFNEYITSNFLILVNEPFYEIFSNKYKKKEENKIIYDISYEKITLSLGSYLSNNIDIKTKNNIISANEDYIKEIKILIMIFIFQKQLKIKIKNLTNSTISGDNNLEHIYIIDEDLIEKLSNYYQYDTLCNLLINIEEVNNEIKKEKFELSPNDGMLNKIINQLSSEYINEIRKETILNIMKNEKNFEKKYLEKRVLFPIGKKLKYLKNMKLINLNIFSFILEVMNSKYQLAKNKVNFFKVEKKFIIRYKENIRALGYNYGSGYINDKNIFIQEYLIDINEKKYISQNEILESIYQFFLNQSSTNNGYFELKGKNEREIGYIYELDSNKIIKETCINGSDNKDVPKKLDNIERNINEEKNIIETEKKDIHIQEENKKEIVKEEKNINNSFKEDSLISTPISIPPEIKKGIKVNILFYLFSIKLKEKLSISLETNINKENYKDNDKIFFVNKKWIEEFQNYYLYNELYQYLATNNIKEINDLKLEEIINYTYIKYKNIYIDKLNNKDIKCPKNIESIKYLIPELSTINPHSDINCIQNTVLIDEQIIKELVSSKIKNGKKPIDYIFDNGKIIIKYERDFSQLYLIIVGQIVEKNNLLVPEIVCDYNKKEKMEQHYKEIMSNGFKNFYSELSIEEKYQVYYLNEKN